MYCYKDNTAQKMPNSNPSMRIKPRPASHICGDAKKITEYLRFFDRNPSWNRMQLQKHIDECAFWMSLMDHRINDCEHVIALSSLAEPDPATVSKAHELLTEALSFRIQLKSHRQECLDKMRNKETVLDGEREYTVRTLHEAFGHVITIVDNRMVIR